jgi:hypothetical protein
VQSQAGIDHFGIDGHSPQAFVQAHRLILSEGTVTG